MSNVVDRVISKVQGDLQSQYVAFRTLMWTDLIIGSLCAAGGNFAWAFGLVIVGLILGNISNSKLILLALETSLQSSVRLEDKLDVLLDEDVQ